MKGNNMLDDVYSTSISHVSRYTIILYSFSWVVPVVMMTSINFKCSRIKLVHVCFNMLSSQSYAELAHVLIR
jgi:hypothetical protein